MKKHALNNADLTGNGIPSYFAFHREERDNVVIISGLDFTLDQKAMPTDKDVEVYADELSIAGELLLYGKNMIIMARRITSENGCINTSDPTPSQPLPRAKDGDPGSEKEPNGKPGENGSQGGKGNDAGNITVVAESFSGHLDLVANGGPGGNGQDSGNGGKGANGNWGNDAQIRHGVPYDKVLTEPTQGHAGGNGGDGGESGKGGTGGKSGIITVGHVTGDVDVRTSCIGGKGGSPGKPGGAGKGGPGGAGGRKAVCEMHAGPAGQQYDCELGDERAASGPNGKDGKPGASGLEGESGASGSAVSLKIDYSDLREKYPWTIEQRILTFHKAKLACLNGKYDLALELFFWLYHVIPEPGLTPSEAAELYRRVEVQLSQLSQGLDFFGNPRNHVPLVSLKYYQDQLDSFFIQGNQIEQAYTQYIQSENDKEAQRKQLRNSISLAESVLKEFRNHQGEVTKQIDQIQNTIEKLSNDLSAQEWVVSDISSEFEKELDAYFEIEIFSDVFQILNSLGLMCASEIPGMKEVVDIGGKIAPSIFKKLSFKDMVKLVKTVSGDVKDLSKNWKEISSYITKDDPHAAKLVMERSDFDNIMKAFVGKIPAAAKFIEEMHKYMDISDARNTQVFAYNASQLQFIKLDAEIQQKTSELKRIQDQLASDFDPTSNTMRCYMLSLYLGVKEQLLDYLFQENQAYRYWSCSWRPLSVADNSITDLNTAHLHLKSDILDLMNMTSPRQPWTLPNPFSFKKSEAPGAFASFLKGQGMAVSIKPTDPAFLGWSRIIASQFTIQVKGAKTSQDILYIRFRCNGRAPFLNEEGEEFIFSHSQVFAAYQYNISTGKKIAGGHLGGEGDEYIGLSPCEPWIIEVPEKYNVDLDLSQVTEIVLDFKGTALPRISRQ